MNEISRMVLLNILQINQSTIKNVLWRLNFYIYRLEANKRGKGVYIQLLPNQNLKQENQQVLVVKIISSTRGVIIRGRVSFGRKFRIPLIVFFLNIQICFLVGLLSRMYMQHTGSQSSVQDCKTIFMTHSSIIKCLRQHQGCEWVEFYLVVV